MRLSRLFVIALLLSACNLTTQSATPTTPPITPSVESPTTPPTPSQAPPASATSAATSTPLGSNPPVAQSVGSTPVISPTSASAEITSPTSGASVSANPLVISGIVHNLNDDHFTLQVFDASDQPLTPAQTIRLSNPNNAPDVPWSASLTVPKYIGAAQIRVIASDSTVIGTSDLTITASISATAAPSNSGGLVGSITAPADRSSISGNPITVTGTAGGIPQNQFTLMLVAANGTTLNSQPITLTGADRYIVPWSATLGTSGYHGQAEIRAVVTQYGQPVTFASVLITLQ